MDGDSEHEERTANVTRMQQPSLRKARWMRRENVVLVYPVPADEVGGALLQVGQQQVEDQHDVLVIADERLIVQAPGRKPESDEAN